MTVFIYNLEGQTSESSSLTVTLLLFDHLTATAMGQSPSKHWHTVPCPHPSDAINTERRLVLVPRQNDERAMGTGVVEEGKSVFAIGAEPQNSVRSCVISVLLYIFILILITFNR